MALINLTRVFPIHGFTDTRPISPNNIDLDILFGILYIRITFLLKQKVNEQNPCKVLEKIWKIESSHRYDKVLEKIWKFELSHRYDKVLEKIWKFELSHRYDKVLAKVWKFEFSHRYDKNKFNSGVNTSQSINQTNQ